MILLLSDIWVTSNGCVWKCARSLAQISQSSHLKRFLYISMSALQKAIHWHRQCSQWATSGIVFQNGSCICRVWLWRLPIFHYYTLAVKEKRKHGAPKYGRIEQTYPHKSWHFHTVLLYFKHVSEFLILCSHLSMSVLMLFLPNTLIFNQSLCLHQYIMNEKIT